MTVAELIEALKAMPAHAEAMLPFYGGAPESIEKVQLTTLIREQGPLAKGRHGYAALGHAYSAAAAFSASRSTQMASHQRWHQDM